MRTTLDIADDVLFAAKDYARRDKKTLGEVISEWGRSALKASQAAPKSRNVKKRTMSEAEMDAKFRALGWVTLPHREGTGIVTNEMVNRIREEEGI